MSTKSTETKHRVYVASSWRNEIQPAVVQALREDGHEVYDFRSPAPGDDGFSWRQLGGRPREEWDADYYASTVLDHPVAARGFELDMAALRACSACVLVLPCGRSAHLELGWAAGQGRLSVVYMPKLDEPELMARMCDYVETTIDGVRRQLSRQRTRPRWQADLAAYDARGVLGGKEYEGLLPSTLTETRYRTPSEQERDERIFGDPLPKRGPCREYHHRECRVCGGRWRHGACTCGPTTLAYEQEVREKK
jgi:hypothetical protein